MKNTKYIIIYSWQVIDTLTPGTEVWMLDREKKSVVLLNELSMSEFASIISDANASEKYEFWYEEEDDEHQN